MNPQKYSGLPEGLGWGHEGGCPSGSVLVCQGNTPDSAPDRGNLQNPLGQLAPGLGKDMVSFQVLCRVSLHCFWTTGAWCCQTLELGPHEERALARVRVRSRDVARAEATPSRDLPREVKWGPMPEGSTNAGLGIVFLTPLSILFNSISIYLFVSSWLTLVVVRWIKENGRVVKSKSFDFCRSGIEPWISYF